MTPRTKIAAVGGAVGVGILSALLMRSPSPTPANSSDPPAVPTTALGFRKATSAPLTALANVSAPLTITRFEPTSSSMVPAGLGRIARAGSILLINKAYGFDKYDLLPAPSFRFGIKTPFPPAGDGQMGCPRAIMDGQRVLAAQRFTKHGVQVYGSDFKRLGEFGVEWTSISGELILDHTTPGAFIAYSIEASGLVRADVSGLPTLLLAPGDVRPSVYRSTRVTAPLSSGISGAGIIAPTASSPGSVLYSTGSQLVAVSLVDQTVLGTWRSDKLGLGPGLQLRGLVTDGANRFAVEAIDQTGRSFGVVSGTLVGGSLSNGVWQPRAPFTSAVLASAFAGGSLYVWEGDGAGKVQLYRDEHELSSPQTLSPTQMVGNDQALYVAEASGTSWIPLDGGAPAPTPSPVPPTPTTRPTPGVTPSATPRPTVQPSASPTPVVSAGCSSFGPTVCLLVAGKWHAVTVRIEMRDGETYRARSTGDPVSCVWLLDGDPIVLVGPDSSAPISTPRLLIGSPSGRSFSVAIDGAIVAAHKASDPAFRTVSVSL